MVILTMIRDDKMLEVANSILGNIPVAVIAAIVAGILRNIAGYIATADAFLIDAEKSVLTKRTNG